MGILVVVVVLRSGTEVRTGEWPELFQLFPPLLPFWTWLTPKYHPVPPRWQRTHQPSLKHLEELVPVPWTLPEEQPTVLPLRSFSPNCGDDRSNLTVNHSTSPHISHSLSKYNSYSRYRCWNSANRNLAHRTSTQKGLVSNRVTLLACEFRTEKRKRSKSEYPASHPFASLQGSDNIIKFTTKYFPNGVIVQGAGAGGPPTAYGIFSDLLKIQERVEGF
ncbi:hypothetical protein K501DRAFT_273229 [Backusella circina FSU 941]|nr:hypothetical protein K501DRAFT_273229 [Backusella circina FSU 941]